MSTRKDPNLSLHCMHILFFDNFDFGINIFPDCQADKNELLWVQVEHIMSIHQKIFEFLGGI